MICRLLIPSVLASRRIDLLRPARKGVKTRPEQRFFKPLRQVIESINDTNHTDRRVGRRAGGQIRHRTPGAPMMLM